MLERTQLATLQLIADQQCVRRIELNHADLWVLHLALDQCRQHGASCVYAEMEGAVRVLQPGEDGGGPKTTQRRVSAVVKSIAKHAVRRKWKRYKEDEVSKTALAEKPFRLRPASPLCPSSAAASALAGVGSKPPPPIMVWWRAGDCVRVKRRAGPNYPLSILSFARHEHKVTTGTLLHRRWRLRRRRPRRRRRRQSGSAALTGESKTLSLSLLYSLISAIPSVSRGLPTVPSPCQPSREIRKNRSYVGGPTVGSTLGGPGGKTASIVVCVHNKC